MATRTPLPHPRPAARQRGTILLAALFVAIGIAGLALGLLSDGMAARKGVNRTESSFLALELAETALARSELELASKLDPGADGCGTLSLAAVGGTARVTCTPHATVPERFILVARAECGGLKRAIEVVVRRRAPGAFIEGLFAHDDMTFDGNVSTDAYDSRLGTYLSQRVNVDADGPYASVGGHVGSNTGFITLHGSAVTVRGDAVPGPGRSVNESGNPTVLGDTSPRQQVREVPDPTLAEFAAAAATNNNGAWTAVGGAPTWTPSTASLTIKANSTVTFPAGTYFFADLKLSSNATLILNGAVKIYVTKSWDTTGGTLVNTSGKPANLQVFAHPYNLPAGTSPTATAVKVAGGAGTALVLYGPRANLTISGNADLFGAAVAKSITINGSAAFHYDKALDDLMPIGVAKVERLAWRDLALPTR